MLSVGVRLPFGVLCIGMDFELLILILGGKEERDVLAGWRVEMVLKMVA